MKREECESVFSEELDNAAGACEKMGEDISRR